MAKTKPRPNASATRLTLSNSKVKDWRRCPHLYYLKRVEGWRPKIKSRALEGGSWIHDLLMHHFDGEDWRERHEVLTKQFYSLFEEEREELGDLPEQCARVMRAYIRHYRDEDKRRRVVETEMDEVIDLPNGLKFRFIIDRIIEDDTGLWLEDTKTTSKKFLPPDFMLLDAQLARYFYCAEKLGYKPLQGIIFDEIRVKPPAIPAQNKNGSLSRRKNIDTDYYTYAREIKRLRLDPKPYMPLLRMLKSQEDKFFRRTHLPKDQPVVQQLMNELVWTAHEIERARKKGEFPRSVDKSCTWCDYLIPCQIALMGGDPKDELQSRFTRGRREKEDK